MNHTDYRGRPPGDGVVYVRRSTTRQESGIHTQLNWAIGEAAKCGVTLDASREDLASMEERRLDHYKGIFLDSGISGAELTRPGLTACRRYVLAHKNVSHLFVHMPDRLARPDSPAEGLRLEEELIKAGITVVFSNRVSHPRPRRGGHHVAEDVLIRLGYAESGEYLNKLAVRMIQSQVNLAKQGHWTGGRPPYGFARFRVFPDGRKERMDDRVTIRSPGTHTEIHPADGDKIKVWETMLHWCKDKGWGGKRIAAELNELGIPSPDVGRVRTENGHQHKVSGLWTSSTVRALLKNTAIAGLLRYGVQSEGHHRRLGPDGPRFLDDADYAGSGDKPKLINNPPELIITSPLKGMEPVVGKDDYDTVQRVLAERGKSQRGISKVRDPSRYPLSPRVFDMNCGWPMYGRTSGQRRAIHLRPLLEHQRTSLQPQPSRRRGRPEIRPQRVTPAGGHVRRPGSVGGKVAAEGRSGRRTAGGAQAERTPSLGGTSAGGRAGACVGEGEPGLGQNPSGV